MCVMYRCNFKFSFIHVYRFICDVQGNFEFVTILVGFNMIYCIVMLLNGFCLRTLLKDKNWYFYDYFCLDTFLRASTYGGGGILKV